ncbi:MAG TPA: hypothetical protein VHC69_30255 [Polyangiaceae bacterium]|nr:hypothetical protein [Polyangiaceae bacterium]
MYRAPDECPDEAAFLSAVRTRTADDAWEAAPGEPARRIEVTVGVAPTGSTARLDFVDDDGHHVARALVGSSCADAVSAIALVTALAIDSRFTHDDTPATTETPAADAAASSGTPNAVNPTTAPNPTTPPAPANASALPNAAVAPRTTRGEPSHEVGERGPRPFRGEIAALGAVTTETEAAAFGGRAAFGIVWPSGAGLRIGADYLVMPQTRVPLYNGVTIAMYELAGRASGCPLGFRVGASVQLSPCGGIASGIIHGETRLSPGVRATGSANPEFVALFAEGRADVRFGDFFLEASGEVRFIVDDPAFALQKPDDRQPLSPKKGVAAFASLGLGVLL